MTGAICLQGGAELTPGCEAMDDAFLRLVGGPVVVLALAAAPGHEYATAQANGARWYRGLGADVLEVPDPREEPHAARLPLERAGLVVLPGGSPARLLEGLHETGLDALLRERFEAGCSVSGASAGAMVLCERVLLPERGLEVVDGLALVPGAVVIPHWSGARPDWEAAARATGLQVLGIPERSGVVVTEQGMRATGQHPTRLVLEGQDLRPELSNGMLGDAAQGGRTVVTEATGAAPVSDRMQALLSRAVEEQVSEQRAVSTVLAELRDHVATLEAGVHRAAANETVAALETAVSTVVADQRTATTLLSQRLEALTKRVEGLAALGEQVDGQAVALQSVRAELANLAAFPTALAALQRDVAGLHDRLAPLGEVRAALGDLSARTGTFDTLGAQIEALQAKVDALGSVPDPERFRDAVVDAVTARLERIQQAVERPVVGPEALKSDLGDLRATLSVALGRELETLAEAVSAVGRRVEQLEHSLAEQAAGADPAPLVGELARLHARFEDVTPLRGQVERLAADVAALRSEQASGSAAATLTSVAEGLERLNERAAAPTGPSSDELSQAVSQRVADRLVETLAPRIADVVLTRVSAALVQQLGETLGERLRADIEQVVAENAVGTEERLTARLDEGVLALAEALLRKKSPTRAKPAAVEPPQELPPVHEVVAELDEPAPAAAAPVDARPSVTTGMAPAPAVPATPAPQQPATEDAPAPKAETEAAATAKAVPPPLKPATRPRPAARKAAPKKAPAKAPAKAVKAPAKPEKRAPVAKKTAPRPRPEVEGARDEAPRAVVPPRPAAPAPEPRPAPPVALPPPPVQRPPVAPPQARPVQQPKRKPWWRPGG